MATGNAGQAYGRLNPEAVANTQRCLLMLKPDGIKQFRKAVTGLSASLIQRNVPHRFVNPTVVQLTQEAAGRLWTDPDVKISRHRRYMTNSYEPGRIVSAPSIAMMLEAYTPGIPLVETLRRFDVIGPTNVEKLLAETPFTSSKKDKDEKDAEMEEKQAAFEREYGTRDSEEIIKRSLRYRMTFGAGGRMWPFPREAEDPMYNGIHCSDSPENALFETGLLFSVPGEGLLSQYSEGGIAVLRAGWGNIQSLSEPLKRVALTVFYSEAEYLDEFTRVFMGSGYRDFNGPDRAELAYESGKIMPLIADQSREFAGMVSGSGRSRPIIDMGAAKGKTLKPTVIGVCGDMGSGKTTLMNLLKGQGYQELVQTTNRGPRGGEDGTEYEFSDNNRFIDSMAQGRFAGIDRVKDTLWGIPLSFMHPANLKANGTRYVVACGPNAIASMKEKLKGNANVVTIFMNCSAETLKNRLEQRNSDSPEELEKRKGHVSSTEERFGPRLPEFDLIIDANVNGPEQCLQLANDFVGRLDRGEVEPLSGPFPAFKMTTGRRLTQYLFDSILFPKEIEARAKLGDMEIDELVAAVEKELGPALKLFLEELYMTYNGRECITNRDNMLVLSNLVRHVLLDYSVSRQIFCSMDNIKASDKRLGQLKLCDDDARMERNIERVRRVTEGISEAERAAITLLHDIGKVARFSGHPAFSASVIDDYDLFQNVGALTGHQKEMIRLMIKYHQNVGDWAYSFLSWDTALDMFRDPEAVQMFRNADGSANMANIEEFLDRTEFFTVCDVAGPTSPNGGLRNMNLELYYFLLDKFRSVFSASSGDYDAAVRTLDSERSLVSEQLAGSLFAFNTVADKAGKPRAHYWALIERSVQKAVDSGEIRPEDWRHFVHDTNFIDNKYCPHFWWIRFGRDPVKPAKYDFYVRKEAEEPPITIIKSYTMIDRILRENVPGFASTKRTVLEHYDRDGEELAGREKEMDGAWQLHYAFANIADYRIEGGKITFIDKSGADIESVHAELVPGEHPFYTLKFFYPRLSYDPNKSVVF